MHSVNYVSCAYNDKALNNAWANANMEAVDCGDYHAELDPLEKITTTIFANEDEAREWIEKKDSFYWQVAVPFYSPINTKYTKKCTELENRVSRLYREYDEMKRKIHYEGVKSQFISCKNCGSKLATSYVKGFRNFCPVCKGDIRPKSMQDRINAKKEAYETAIEILTEERKRCEAKATQEKRWLIKYEYHC